MHPRGRVHVAQPRARRIGAALRDYAAGDHIGELAVLLRAAAGGNGRRRREVRRWSSAARACRRSCANGRRRRWRCSRPWPSGSAAMTDQVVTYNVEANAPDRDGHVPAHRRRGLDGPRRELGPRGTNSTPRTWASSGSRRRARRHGRPDRGRRGVRGLPGGGAAVAAAVDASARSPPTTGRTAPICASGWGSTPARPTSPATTTAASRSTARPGSRRPAMAARSCSPSRPEPSSRTTCRMASPSATSGGTCSRTCRGPSASSSSTAGAPNRVPAAPQRRRRRSAICRRLTTFVGRDASSTRSRSLAERGS